MISVLLFTEGLVNELLSRNSFKTPVFSNFFLKRLRALSIDSFSLMLIISMFHYLGCKYILFLFNFKGSLQNCSGNHQFLNFRGSFPNCAQFRVSIELLHREILDIAIAAKNLNSVIGYFYRYF